MGNPNGGVYNLELFFSFDQLVPLLAHSPTISSGSTLMGHGAQCWMLSHSTGFQAQARVSSQTSLLFD